MGAEHDVLHTKALVLLNMKALVPRHALADAWGVHARKVPMRCAERARGLEGSVVIAAVAASSSPDRVYPSALEAAQRRRKG